MNRSEHLTENQLNAYFGDSALIGEAKHEIGRHLLQCDFCLKRLPQPTAEQFWTALMTENEDEDSGDERTSLAARLEFIVQLFEKPKIFALGAAALAVVLFFSAFIWLNAAKSSEAQNEVAQNFEVKDSQPVFNQTGNVEIEKPDVFPRAESNIPSAPAKERITAKQEPTNSNAPKQNLKNGSRNDFNLPAPAKSPGAEKANISSTRGGSSTLPECGSEAGVEMTTGGDGEAVRLKWKKVPKAAKYHLYVSDDEEILVDEYETEQETSYVLKKPLDPAKTYKWKIVITLEDGKTVIGDSQKFTIKSLEFNQRKSGRKEKSEIRCSQQN